MSELTYKQPHIATQIDKAEQAAAFQFCDAYKDFLDKAKTEREAVQVTVQMAEAAGFKPFTWGMSLQAGDKIYYQNRNKSIILAVIGSAPISEGVRILAAHIDACRLDLKQNPLYEKEELAYFKTHYYGGIKKYQWVSMPLSLHGVVFLADGTKKEVCIGEDDNDPVLYITDLLPHLAQDQMKRSAPELIKGEELNLLIGSMPVTDDADAKCLVKEQILQILNEKCGITEKDFRSAELSAVPAMKAKDVGLDRSLIGAYGHDDRVCSYTALKAILELENPTHTALCVLADKEEIGSCGNTGLESTFMAYFIEDIAETLGSKARIVLSASKCLSADVNSAYDPTFPDVFEAQNSSFCNRGVVVTKFTGARGKSGSSDAHAEFIAEVHHLLDANNVVWQTGELGRVDLGGGGTVAAYIANLNVDVVDVGVPVLSMHAPYEVVAKLDVYMTYKAFEAFIK